MNDHEPTPLSSPLQQAMAGALRPMFGENLEAYYAEQERHDAEARELIDRELHEALIEAKERFNRRVQALRIEPEEP